ncbi:suppressor protein SRP40 isoform X2 [Populus trichocarpa]|uniref:Srp40 C-terminal domain-containing protein n=1 Tax=Populus trichocarpa TaxID=3694 RepID=A0A3N7HAV7_POPTR|nr:suppressor protein SRP40 isoform X2 [Populus trichocarpa]|eukprot:XP_024445555.1 suppressor protein SRP40 isoform X2 [Populus trichocarpa]
MKQENNKDNSKTQTLKPEQKTLLLHSIAKYLENTGGFSKTLKKFESEAKFEKDDLGGDSLIDLEEVFCKFLKTSDDTSKKLESNQVQGAGDKVNNSESVEEIITNETVATEVRSKEKKEKKRNSDSHGQEEQDNVEALKEPADNGAGELPDKKRKDKRKKKSNLESESQDDNDGHHLAESVSVEEKSKDVASSKGNKVTDGETDNKPKDKKRKKDKLFDSTIGNGEQHILESKQGANADSILDNKNIKSERKKKRKDAVFSENLSAEMLDEGKSNSEKDDSKNLKEDVNDKENKSSKKRKRLSSEDDAPQPANETAIEESKRRKTESSEELKENVQANGNLEENGAKSAPQKSMMKEKNGSVEPKTVKHFQRVKVDEVVFSDERLKDNSYWAKDGAEDGYGAKAQEVLGQVRGRGFRHEKTKKKRGTYRGGQIDLQSHSFKFNYSDED